jgi:hypothetical protein
MGSDHRVAHGAMRIRASGIALMVGTTATFLGWPAKRMAALLRGISAIHAFTAIRHMMT